MSKGQTARSVSRQGLGTDAAAPCGCWYNPVRLRRQWYLCLPLIEAQDSAFRPSALGCLSLEDPHAFAAPGASSTFSLPFTNGCSGELRLDLLEGALPCRSLQKAVPRPIKTFQVVPEWNPLGGAVWKASRFSRPSAPESHQDGLRTSHQAGVWFPGKAAELRADVDSMLDAAFAASGTVKALVVPHAAYTYSGQVAAAAFKQMQSLQRTLKHVVLLASWHAKGTGLMVPPQEYSGYGSPIDSVPIDTEALNALLHTGWYDIAPFALEKAEHSVAVQIPFLRRVLPEGALLLPIYVGSLIDEELPSLAETLAILFKDPALDREAIDCVVNLDKTCLENHMKKTRNQICGYDALRLFLTVVERTAEMSGVQPRNLLSSGLLKYGQSNKIVNPNDSTVGYAAIGFFSSN
ncbi:hypothetical protein cyc_03701 [Cyclospora cayetanensis]|uniref:AmmeMemoRadiSam system protein B n=1 Tax=Cyclospora cayetanensis TaxID=88456 RepID=A0A1D3CSV7_9EIME|nr:hypothetical protein cyc_03701 [Cyclospora cayetanensis]